MANYNEQINGGDGVESLKISYANKRVERYFSDYKEMGKKIPLDWVRTIKKHVDRLKAADTFGDFLKLGLGRPEPLKGKKDAGKYSLRVTGNVRLIVKPSDNCTTVMICEEVLMEGVVDYHGETESWYIS